MPSPSKDAPAPAPAAAAPSPALAEMCCEKGIRLTWQRKLILSVLSDAADHPDAEEIYRRAHKKDKRISLSTVYRTVSLLQEAGIVEKHNFRDATARYERADAEHHDHLIDVESGRVMEFQNEEIERLQLAIARKLGYRLISHRLELYGVPLKSARHKKHASQD